MLRLIDSIVCYLFISVNCLTKVYMKTKNYVMLCICVNDLTKVYMKAKNLLSNIL